MKKFKNGFKEFLKKAKVLVIRTKKYTPEKLLKAIKEAETDLAIKLTKEGVNVNVRDKEGKTPLIIACEKGYWDLLDELIKKGANLDDKDNCGNTGLSYAVRYYRSSVASKLIQAGAHISKNDIEGIQRLRAKDNLLEAVSAIIGKDSQFIEKTLDDYYKELKIKDINNNYSRNAGSRVEKLQKAKKYAIILNRSAKDTIGKEKQELKKYITEIKSAKDEDGLSKIINNIAQENSMIHNRLDKELISVNEFIKGTGDIYKAKEDLVHTMENEVEKTNKVIFAIRNLETKLDMDYKQVIFTGINMGRENKSKGKGLEL